MKDVLIAIAQWMMPVALAAMLILVFVYRFLFPQDAAPRTEARPENDPRVTGEDPRPVRGKWPEPQR